MGPPILKVARALSCFWGQLGPVLLRLLGPLRNIEVIIMSVLQRLSKACPPLAEEVLESQVSVPRFQGQRVIVLVTNRSM